MEKGRRGAGGGETVLGHGVRVDDGVEAALGQAGVEGISQIVGLVGQFGLEALGSARVGGTRVAVRLADRGEGILPAESQSVQRRVGIDVLQVVERLVPRLAQVEAGAVQSAVGEETDVALHGVVLQRDEGDGQRATGQRLTEVFLGIQKALFSDLFCEMRPV